MVPRWSFPCDNSIKQVEESWMIGDMSNTVSPVRKERGIHKIHNQDFDYGTDDEIDLDETADAIQKTENRLLIRPELHRIRNRSNKDGVSSENVIEVSDDQVTDIIDHVEEKADTFRSLFLRRSVPLLLGYDIAAGESEAVVRDILKTDIEIDDELLGYIGSVTLADMISETMKTCDNIPDNVRADVLKDWLIKSFDGVRNERSGMQKSNLLRRLMNGHDGIIANGQMPLLGTARGLSQRNGKET